MYCYYCIFNTNIPFNYNMNIRIFAYRFHLLFIIFILFTYNFNARILYKFSLSNITSNFQKAWLQQIENVNAEKNKTDK
jgi:hypothetical protein